MRVVNKIIVELRELRRKKNISQEQVAVYCGISQPAIARIESGGIDPAISTVQKICMFLGVEMTLYQNNNEVNL